MSVTFKLYLFILALTKCKGVSVQEQLEHIVRANLESLGISPMLLTRRLQSFGIHPTLLTRRQSLHLNSDHILGVPTSVQHLPEAEPILPGQTLIKPALGMLKSAIKFPHKELENGAGVNGNLDNLGIKYGGRNERLQYSGFRRTLKTFSDTDESSSDLDIDTYLNTLLSTYQRVTNKAVKTLASRRNGMAIKDSDWYSYLETNKKMLNPEEDEDSDKENDVNDVMKTYKPVEPLLFQNDHDDSQQKSSMETEEEDPQNKGRFWNLKMTGDHVNIRPHAIEFTELFPPGSIAVQPKKQWFYLGEVRLQN